MRRKSGQLVPLEVAILEAAVAMRTRGARDFHGYSLAKAISTAADQRALTAHGTLYRALHRLEGAGLLESFWDDPAHAEAEGRPRRRMYRLTAAAEPALARARAAQREPARLRALKGALDTP